MQFVSRLATAIACAVLSTASLAGAVYTSSASFLAKVKPGSYTETFNGLDNSASPSFSGGAFGYTISSPGDIYFSGDFVGTNLPNLDLTIDFTGNVTALGANFFASNISDEFQAVSLTLTLSDGTIETFTPTSLLDSYRGFTTDVAISSLVISGPGESLYAGLDNLTVGVSAVPEPETWALFAAGLLGLRLVRRRAA
jgi:hypothetical protein